MAVEAVPATVETMGCGSQVQGVSDMTSPAWQQVAVCWLQSAGPHGSADSHAPAWQPEWLQASACGPP
jgi:hypothetical protein